LDEFLQNGLLSNIQIFHSPDEFHSDFCKNEKWWDEDKVIASYSNYDVDYHNKSIRKKYWEEQKVFGPEVIIPGDRLIMQDSNVQGEYILHQNNDHVIVSSSKKMVQAKIKETNAKNVSALVLAANPLNRAHERMIRQALEQSDLVVIFLLKPFTKMDLRYDVRHDALLTFVESFLPTNKVIVAPLENSYIFAGYNELILDALVAKNYGCHNLFIGKNHAGLGLFYDHDKLNSVFDATKDINIKVTTVEQYVYCNKCRTLVSTKTCPHGQHHHVHYHSASILKLINAGMMPPSVLIRREVSASILSALFPDRFENLQELYDSLMPNDGLIEEHTEEDFYIKLMGLYQTTSLT